MRKKHNAPLDHHSKNISDDVRRIIKKARDEFYKIDEVYSKELHKVFEGYHDPKINKLINKILGKSILPKSSGMGKEFSIEGIDEIYFSKPWNIKFRDKNKKTLEKDKKIPYVIFSTPERTPSLTSKNVTMVKGITIIRPTIKEIEKEKINYSKKKGYHEIIDGFMELASTMYFHTFIDVFCKKGKDYYVFDIKQKTYKENKNLNKFHVTNYEVLNYDRIIKENKAKLKIMIIVEKSKKSFYKIFDWSDFHIPETFDPHTKMATSIRLKNGLDLKSFRSF